MIPHILPWGRAMAVWLWVLLPRMTTKHYSDLTWSSWHLKSPVIRLFIQYLVQANIKENIKLRITAPSPHPSQSAASSEIVSMPWHHHGHRYDVYEWYIIHRNKADTIEDGRSEIVIHLFYFGYTRCSVHAYNDEILIFFQYWYSNPTSCVIHSISVVVI